MVEVERAASATAEVRGLVEALEAELSAAYPAEQRHGLPFAALFRPEIRFFVARLDGQAAGCGGFALLDGFAEVKRMFVRPEARGQGVAQALLARIEGEARSAGMAVLRLETGTAQIAAMRLYERAGFVERSAFGAYGAMDAGAIAGSVFYEKALA